MAGNNLKQENCLTLGEHTAGVESASICTRAKQACPADGRETTAGGKGEEGGENEGGQRGEETILSMTLGARNGNQS